MFLGVNMAGKVDLIKQDIATARKLGGQLLGVLQFNGWFILLDLALLITAILMIVTPAKVLFFHIVFILLTLGAFYWLFRAFAIRAVFWVAVTTIVVILAIVAGETQVEEIIEIPLLTSVLILVFVIAEQRSSAEDALRQSEERYHTLFDNLFKESQDAIFITDKENKILDINQSMIELFDYDKNEILGLNYQDVFIRNGAALEFQRTIDQQGFVRDFEVDFYKKNGDRMYFLLTISEWRANDDAILGFQGIIRDVTQQKQAETSLRESEERYRRLVELSFEGVVVHSEGKFLYANGPATKIVGSANPHDLIGKPILNFVHPDYLEVVKERVQQATQSGVGAPLVEEKFLRPDGTGVDVEVAAVPITYHGKPAIQTVFRDITPRKKAEIEKEKLLATEHEQRLLAETLGEVFLALTAQTSYETVLDEILRQVQRVVSHSAANIVLLQNNKLRIARFKGYHTAESQQLISNLEQLLQDYPLDAQVVQSRQPLVVPDTGQNAQWVTISQTAWIKSFVAVPICLRDRVLGLLRLDSDTPNKFSMKDAARLLPLAHAAAIALENARLYDQARQEIAERVEVERELRQIAAKNQAILDAIPDSIFHLDREGRIVDYKIHDGNLTFEMFGEAGIDKTLANLPWFSPSLVDLFLHNIDKTLTTGETQIFEFQLRFPTDTRDFETWLVMSHENEVLAIVRDVTERKAREAAVEKERSRMARDLHDSLGQNLGYLRLKFDEWASKGDELYTASLKRDLIEMRDVANDAYELVRNILAAARPSNSTDLASALLAQARLFGHRAHFEISLTTEGQPRTLSPVVQQQVLYIFQEALSNVEKHARADRVDFNLVWTEEQLLIKLTDNGCGFETNAPRSTGHYGLTIMQERAEDIQSFLSVSSTPGHGATLVLQLPLPVAL